MNKNILLLIVAAILLLCLAPMPYGFYTLVRFVAMAVFAYCSFRFFDEKRSGLGFTFAALALLFQPFIKIALGRVMWNVVDVIVAIGLIILFFMDKNKKIVR